MAYQPRTPLPATTLLGNAGASAAVGSTILPGPDLEFDGTTLKKIPPPVRHITDSYTLQISDVGRSIVATNVLNMDFYLPRSFPRGFKTRVYQGSTGQVLFQTFGGGTIINGTVATLSSYTNGTFVEIENLGNDTWVVTGSYAAGILNWSIYGDTVVREGDVAGFCINYPSVLMDTYPAGITITVTGTDFDTAGWDRTLAQGLADACLLDPFLTFDGTSVLTVKKGAANPITLNFFAKPDYTETTDRTATITISAPSQGPISGDHVDCLIRDVSKPTSPDLLFPDVTITTSGSSSSGQAVIILEDATGLQVYGTVVGTGIPDQTWIQSITDNTITLSANLTGTIDDATSLTYHPPGFWFDFSTADHITKDGSNNVSQAVDLISGYTINQATGANKPVWSASALNSLGGLVFDGSKWLAATVANQITKTSSGDTAAGATAITVTSVTSVVPGMLVTDSGGLVHSSTTVSSVVGSVVHLSKATTNNVIPSGTTITFTPAASKHPLVNILDGAKQKFTVIIVAQLSASDTGFYAGWDCLNFQCSADSKHAFIGDAAAQENLTNTAAVGCPYIWQYVCDGSAQQVFVNGQNPITHATLTQTAVSNGGTGYTIDVDDTSGFGTGSMVFASQPGLYYQRMDTVVSSTRIYITHNPLFQPWISQDIPSGSVLSVQSRALGNVRTAQISQQFVLGSLVGAGFSSYCRGDQVDFTATPDGCVVGGTSAFPFKGTIFELIVVPRMLELQEMRGLTLYLATKWGVGTTTTSWSEATGATTVQLASVAGIYYGQVIGAATGIAGGTMVTGVNSTASTIKIDTPVQAPGLSNGTSLTFTSPGFKQPEVVDVTDFYPTFRDDFHNLNLGTGATQWRPYYGSPGNPADTFSTAYSATGHGSSNGVGFTSGIVTSVNETEWYLDVLNWIPWQQYSPFTLQSPPGARSGELVITASPVPPEIANLIGYAPPNPLFTYISGYLANSYTQQYGYWECRAKCPNVDAMWPAYWLAASDGIWPPENDVMEMLNGASAGAVGGGLHSNRTTVGIPTYQDFPRFDAGHMLLDASANYVLYGTEVGPITTSLYLNREKYATFPTPWDFYTFWYQQLNLAVNANEAPDHVTSGSLHTDYVGVWRRLPQTQTVPSGTQVETTALVAVMLVAPTAPRQALINTLIASLKTYQTSFGLSFWDALDFLYLVAAHDEQAAWINWKNPAQIGTKVGSPTWTVNKGYIGSYGVSYIDTGINLSTAGFRMTAASNHIGAAGANMNNISSDISVKSSIGTAVAGNETGSTYGMRLGDAWVYGRNISGTSSWTLTIGGGSLFARSGYAVSARNEYSVQGYVFAPADTNGVPVKVKQANAIYGNGKPALDNANLVIANCETVAVVSCAHGGVFLTQDDAEILYPLLYNYLHALGAI